MDVETGAAEHGVQKTILRPEGWISDLLQTGQLRACGKKRLDLISVMVNGLQPPNMLLQEAVTTGSFKVKGLSHVQLVGARGAISWWVVLGHLSSHSSLKGSKH